MSASTFIPVKLFPKKSHKFLNFPTFFHFSVSNGDLGSCVSSLKSCALNKYLSVGKQIHSWMLINGLHDSPYSITSLINFYSKCSQPLDALAVFNGAHDRNLFTWNALLAGYVCNGLSKDALDFYRKMRHQECLVPDKFTFPCAIKACCELGEVREVGRIHAELFKIGLDSDSFVASSMINFYLRYGFMLEAQQLFEQMPRCDRDVVLWNSIINGYAQSGLFGMALDVFGRMMREELLVPSKFTVTGILSVFGMIGDVNNGKVVHGFVKKIGYESDVVVSNSLIDMYGKCKLVADSDQVFEEIVGRDIFSWNSIISVHDQASDYYGTLRLFDEMRDSGFQPDIITITSVLPSCSQLSALMRGREIHGYMVVNAMGQDGHGDDVNDLYVENALMDMYAKCGSLNDAQMVFNKMKDRDVASWNIMIMGYGMHGYGDQALAVFRQMLEAQLQPDEVTFVNVLSACSHAGLVVQGREILGQMESDYDIVPTVEHYACAVDMLGRAGNLVEAYELAKSSPIKYNPVVWRAILAACRLHGNTSLAEIVVRKIVELEPKHSGSYVLISNIYGSIGKYENVLHLRHAMRTQNVKKTPGCSWVELKNGLHVFANGDQSHPESSCIYTKLESLIGHLYEYDFVPDVGLV